MVSGGLDSILATRRLDHWGFDVTPLFVNYGQYPWKKELNAASDCLGPDIEVLTVSLDANPNFRVGSLWGRGIMLVGLAASWAYVHGNCWDYVSLGNHQGDVGPDCKPGMFDDYLNKALELATKGDMHLLLPVEDLTTEEIGKELVSYTDLCRTYSCYWDPPCGFKSKNDSYRCPGCRRKAIAMAATGQYTEKEMDLPNCKERTYQSPLAEKLEY